MFFFNFFFKIFVGVEMSRGGLKMPKFVVIGHRGHGMNALQSSDQRMRAIKENSIVSFNAASTFPLDFIEFDVQVTFLSFCYFFYKKKEKKSFIKRILLDAFSVSFVAA